MPELFGVRISSPREMFNDATAAAQSLGDGAVRFGSSALSRANELGRTIDSTVRDAGAQVDRFIGDTQRAAQTGIRDGVNWTGQQIHRGAEAARTAVGDDTLLGRAASGVITGVEHRARFSVGVVGGVATEAVGLAGTVATVGSTAVQMQLSPTRREEVTTAIVGAVGSGLDTAVRYSSSVAADPSRLLGDAQAVGQGALDLGGRVVNHYQTAIAEGRGPEAFGMTAGQALTYVIPVGAGANAARATVGGVASGVVRETGEAVVRETGEAVARGTGGAAARETGEAAARRADDLPPPPLRNNPIDLSTANRTPAEAAAITEYAQRSNAWLDAAGPQTIQSTAGALRAEASAAARAERLNAARNGTPYSGQAGHVPDTAVTGLANPPAGWLDMPGVSNQAAGGVLGSRIGQTVDHFTVDGVVP